jgi:hypothetical protein
MSIELIAILITAGIQSIIAGIGLAMLFRIYRKPEADDSAIYLRIEQLSREMRESLRQP